MRIALSSFLFVALVHLAWGQKALIVNAPDGSLSSNDISLMRQILSSEGYAVTVLEGGRATWPAVKSNAQGAHVFVYSGHGSNQGYEGTGGLCLSGSARHDIVSSFTVEKEVKLAPGALVIFKSVCGGAGSSASDRGTISTAEAVKRVSAYSHAFFNMGAEAYFADNTGGRDECGAVTFLRLMTQGQTLKQAYDARSATWFDQRYFEVLDYDPSKKVAVAQSNWGDSSFNLAISGNPEYRLKK